MNKGKRSRKKIEEYCRRLKARLATLFRTLAQLTRQDRLAVKARIKVLQKEYEEKCPESVSAEAGGAPA